MQHSGASVSHREETWKNRAYFRPTDTLDYSRSSSTVDDMVVLCPQIFEGVVFLGRCELFTCGPGCALCRCLRIGSVFLHPEAGELMYLWNFDKAFSFCRSSSFSKQASAQNLKFLPSALSTLILLPQSSRASLVGPGKLHFVARPTVETSIQMRGCPMMLF